MITLVRKTAPAKIEVVALSMTFNQGYEIRPGGEPEKKGDPYWVEIAGNGWSKWVQCTNAIKASGVIAIKVQCRQTKDKNKGLCFAPVALLEVDVEGDGKWQKVGNTVSTAYGDDEEAATPAPANSAGAAVTHASAPAGAPRA